MIPSSSQYITKKALISEGLYFYLITYYFKKLKSFSTLAFASPYNISEFGL